MKDPGAQFLHERNPQFHASQEVEAVTGYLRAGGDAIPNDPAAKIGAYLGFLADPEYVNDGILTGDPASIERQVEARVVKEEDVPEAYFRLQQRIFREQGHGDVDVHPIARYQMIEAAQADQRAGLEEWVEYLGGDDGGYPDWFKLYAWNSIIKLGTFDKEKGEFQNRGQGTMALYPELNREALAYVYDAVEKSRSGGHSEQIINRKGKDLLASPNFGKLYSHAVLEVTPDSPEIRNDTRGSWTKFSQTQDPRTARRLAGTIRGHGTGWCTAGETVAQTQLAAGDFYVYYTRDEEGKDTIPRVAVRMENNQVAEVRGVSPNQELEPVMAEIVSEKLEDLPGGEVYVQKAEDMKRMTALENKLKDDPQARLSDEELCFLYERDHKIEGFGYRDDPRVLELQSKLASLEMADMLEQIGFTSLQAQRVRNHIIWPKLREKFKENPGLQLTNEELMTVYNTDKMGHVVLLERDHSGDMPTIIWQLQIKFASLEMADTLEQLGASSKNVQRVRNYALRQNLSVKLKENPNTPLTDGELRLLYELDAEPLQLGKNPFERRSDNPAKKLDQLRHGKDRERLTLLLREAVLDQLQTAHQAYVTVAKALDEAATLATEKDAAGLLADKDLEWRTQGVYEHLVTRLIEHDDSSSITLVATPNLEVDGKHLGRYIQGLTNQYGFEERFFQGAYTAEQLSGSRVGLTPLRFSLISSAPYEELAGEDKQGPHELENLQALQATTPQLHLSVPSILEAVAYSQALRTADVSTTAVRIRHFDLPPTEAEVPEPEGAFGILVPTIPLSTIGLLFNKTKTMISVRGEEKWTARAESAVLSIS